MIGYPIGSEGAGRRPERSAVYPVRTNESLSGEYFTSPFVTDTISTVTGHMSFLMLWR